MACGTAGNEFGAEIGLLNCRPHCRPLASAGVYKSAACGGFRSFLAIRLHKRSRLCASADTSCAVVGRRRFDLWCVCNLTYHLSRELLARLHWVIVRGERVDEDRALVMQGPTYVPGG